MVVILIFIIKDQLKGLVNRSNLKISWGDKSIELSELADSVDQDIDPIKERLDLLEDQIRSIGNDKPYEPQKELMQPTKADIEKIIDVALKNPRYKYRTVSGVAKEANISRTIVQRILSSHPNIRVVKARDGRELYAAYNKPSQQDK